MFRRGTLIVALVAALALVLGASPAVAQPEQHNPADVNFLSVGTAVSKSVVGVGETFEIKLTLSNSANRPIFVDSMDVHDELLAGIRIKAVNPPSLEEPFHIPIDNSMSYTMRQTIPAKGTLLVVFTCEGTKTGTASGNVDICVTYADCKYIPVSVNVK